MSSEPVEVGLRVTAALDYARASDEADIRPHYLWQLERITETVTLDDLTTSELVALTALLIPAHSRLLAGLSPTDQGPPGKVLRLVGGCDGEVG